MFTLDGGYRIYDGGTSSELLLSTDVKKDLWSRWVDWHALNDWALPAFGRAGGNLRPTGEYASSDFSLLTSDGWRIIMANYPHETVFNGNLFAEGSDSLFDISRITSQSVVPRIQGSANLLTYNITSGGSGTSAESIRIEMDTNSIKLAEIVSKTNAIKVRTDVLEPAPSPQSIADAVRLELSPELGMITEGGLTNQQATMLLEMYRLLGLDPTRPLVVTATSRSAGVEIGQIINTNSTNTIVTRNV
jgi:hypothetical protein